MKRLAILVLVFFTCACELIVDVDVPFKGEQLVVNSIVCPDSLWSASISLNQYILDGSLPYETVTNATVTIHDENGPVATLQHLSDGEYRSQTEKPLAGKQYTIHVSAPNYTAVEAQSWIPNPTVITSVEVEKAISTEVTKIAFMDNGDTKDFYHIRLEVIEWQIDYRTGEVSLITFTYPYVSSDNPELNSQFISVDGGLLVKDVLFNGEQAEARIKMKYSSPYYFTGMRVVVRSVSEDYYNYMATKKLQNETSGDPFAQPVNVYNNISNGFGIFAGLSSAMFEYYNPQPVVTEISPSSGKVGDIITIMGQNFSSDLRNSNVTVKFKGESQYGIYADVIEATDTQLKVVVPYGAISGSLLVFRDGSFTQSDVEFQVTN